MSPNVGWNELSFDGAVFGLRCAQMAPGEAKQVFSLTKESSWITSQKTETVYNNNTVIYCRERNMDQLGSMVRLFQDLRQRDTIP